MAAEEKIAVPPDGIGGVGFGDEMRGLGVPEGLGGFHFCVGGCGVEGREEGGHFGLGIAGDDGGERERDGNELERWSCRHGYGEK